MARQRGKAVDSGLAGKRIAVTRPAGQADWLLARLRELGADPLACPTIRIADPVESGPLNEAADHVDDYDWIVFTSTNGVDRFFEALEARGRGWPEGTPVAAIGPATAEALEERGVPPSLQPGEYVAEAVAEALIEAGMEGRRVLLPRAAGARAVLRERLEAAGALVDEVPAYESRPDEEGIAELRSALDRGEVDMVTFTAASTVEHFVSLAGPQLGRARVAVIGPITARVARSRGLQVDTVASDYTAEGLVQAIREYYAGAGDQVDAELS